VLSHVVERLLPRSAQEDARMGEKSTRDMLTGAFVPLKNCISKPNSAEDALRRKSIKEPTENIEGENALG